MSPELIPSNETANSTPAEAGFQPQANGASPVGLTETPLQAIPDGRDAASPAASVVEDQPRIVSDFIEDYVHYADILEAPPDAHEAVAAELIASAVCEKVFIPHGADRVPLDLWLLLLSGSGFGRNTLVSLARPVMKAAGLSGLIHNRTWGSRQALYQMIAEHPVGLFVWPELSVVLKKLGDKSFAGAKEWLTDLYDNLEIPEAIRYRVTGKKSDTPPIEFSQAPRINILATSSVDWFLSNVSQEDALGGFIPRWVVRELARGKSVPFPKRPDQSAVAALAEHLRRAHELSGEADISRIQKYYSSWYGETQKRFSEHQNSSLAMPFFNRLRTHVLKLAVIYEVSQTLSLRVTPRSLGRAIRAAQASETAILRLLATGLSREGAEVDRMAEVIRTAGPEGISRNDLTRAFQNLKSFEREGRLSTLTDSRKVHWFLRGTSGAS